MCFRVSVWLLTCQSVPVTERSALISVSSVQASGRHAPRAQTSTVGSSPVLLVCGGYHAGCSEVPIAVDPLMQLSGKTILLDIVIIFLMNACPICPVRESFSVLNHPVQCKW